MRYAGFHVSQVDTAYKSEKSEDEAQLKRALQIKALIADFERRANDLEQEVVMEEKRAGIHDPAHYAYPTYAKAASLRRDNLQRSADELRAELQRSGLTSSAPGDNRTSNARHVMSLRRESLAGPASLSRL